ncbi:MAG: dicarboxylate/amino acid:cation symporter [Burkholderiales bacterium]|nr:dicarboxylate/amino acid:cation symporter [Burkholderiales bacterium]|tara:strand:+ start:5839 stop:7131 length:1293 start_codon:yes stop_codon:yes gene_type:complete
MGKLALHWQIIIAVVLAGIVGSIVKTLSQDGEPVALLGISVITVFEYVGQLFLNALKMIIVPLIASSIIVGMCGIGSSGARLAKIGTRTLLFYAITTLFAILVGLALINVVSPGQYEGRPIGDLLAFESRDVSAIQETIENKGSGDVAEIFLRMIPPNIVEASAEGQMLGIIFFSILFGFFITKLSDELRTPFVRFWDATFKVMMNMTGWIMKFAPIGVFALVAGVISKTGFDAARPLAIFSLTVLGALLVHALVVLPILLRSLARVRPWAVLRAMSPAILTAFSTASSSATLPVSMKSLEKNVGISNNVSSFVLPLGATVNMNGTALYECAAAMFIAQAYGLDLTFGVQFTIIVVALLTSIGVAGVPSASLVAIAIILGVIGLPVEAIGVLMVFDRALDMCRTSVNIWGDAVCATIIARLEGEKTQTDL